MTNKQKILEYLNEKPFITQRKAVMELDMNGTTFTRAITDLIRGGFDIQKMMVDYVNSKGEKKRFKMYWLGDKNVRCEMD